MRALELLPAIDIKNGKSVRLKQADLDSAEQYENPNVVLSDFVAKGAKWVHLVDLDAAFQSGSNSELIQELISVSPIKIQLSGGIINENTLQKALSTKADRINIATAALQNIDWVVKAIKSNNERLILDKVLKSTKSLIIASGGISKLSDLKDLREMGLDGVIVGKALYVGAIDISAAIKTCYQ